MQKFRDLSLFDIVYVLGRRSAKIEENIFKPKLFLLL
jgi:hypothetical protein